MRRFLLPLILSLCTSTAAIAADGVIDVKSAHSVSVTADRLENILKKKGMTVFARIDHAAGAKKAGKKLRPTELVIFGNPKVGTPLMKCSQSIAIDLPQKALIWKDADGNVWLSYNDPQHLVARHNTQGCEKVIKKVTGALAKFSSKATAAE
ncbi:MAG: DUF302 domain-containing protein [Pseudomonadota bacterium]